MKTLIITYTFPPIAGAGIQRTLKFIKYLSQNNITPIVFCPKNALWHAMDYRNLELDYIQSTQIFRCGGDKLKRYYHLRYTKGYEQHIYYYLLALQHIWKMDFFSSWYNECYRQVKDIAERENISCVYTSSPPHSVHLFGEYLKKELNIPWIMDLRDPMFDRPNSNENHFVAKFTANIERYYEKRFYNKADAILSVSQPILDSIYRRHYTSYANNKFHVITNGFDDEDFNNIRKSPDNEERLIITYTGSFLGKKTPEDFLKSLESLALQSEISAADIVIKFIGHFDENVCYIFNKYNTLLNIEIIDHQPYDKALEYQANAHILLLINSSDTHEGGDQILTGKFFEYIGSLKPIFALTPEGPLKQILEEGRFGLAAPARDIEAIKIRFKEMYNIWKKYKYIPFNPDMEMRESFTRKNLTKKLAAIMHDCS